jgi:hypothetical protein
MGGKMKKIFIIILALVIFGCSKNKIDNMDRISNNKNLQKIDNFTIYDNRTNIVYYYNYNLYGPSITPMFDSDGKVMTLEKYKTLIE